MTAADNGAFSQKNNTQTPRLLADRLAPASNNQPGIAVSLSFRSLDFRWPGDDRPGGPLIGTAPPVVFCTPPCLDLRTAYYLLTTTTGRRTAAAWPGFSFLFLCFAKSVGPSLEASNSPARFPRPRPARRETPRRRRVPAQHEEARRVSPALMD